MCPPGCQHRGFMATHALGHIMYGIYKHTHIYMYYIYYIILCYILYIYIIYMLYFTYVPL